MKEASISACGLYRTMLARRSLLPGRMLFVMLNPSTADAAVDDPTIGRCLAFARREDKGTLLVANLFTLRSPKPPHLWLSGIDPVGPEADASLRALLEEMEPSDVVVAGWGALPGSAPKDFASLRAQRVRAVLEAVASSGLTIKSLGTTADGSPRHPLYIRGNEPLNPFSLP